MRSTTKKPHATDRAVKVIRSSKGVGDTQSRKFARMQKKMGNAGLGGKLSDGASTRDQLLAFTCHRLRVMRSVQMKEHAEFDHVREWFRQVAKGQDGFHLPDPTRWHEAAKFMKAAAIAMCNGNLTRGAQLLEQGLEHERAAFNSLPTMVRSRLEGEETGATEAPAELDKVAPGTQAPERNLPQELVWADRILAVTDVFEELSSLRPRRHQASEEEQESDDEADKKEGKGDGKDQSANRSSNDQTRDEDEEEELEDEAKDKAPVKDDNDDEDDDEAEPAPRRWWAAGD